MTEPSDIVVARLPEAAQRHLLEAVVAALAEAPFFRPTMPRWGTPFSVRMSNMGPLGWVSDKSGYRYQPLHPETGRPWPEMPQMLRDLWAEHAGYPHPPEACLVNHYGPEAKLGLHQDADEAATDAPVVSLSLGDDCRFRLGGPSRTGPTRAFRLGSGDLVVLGGPSRMAFHGVDRIYPGTSTLLRDWLPDCGRINLTLRRVTRPA